MANQLKMADIQAILVLKRRGWSDRRIARELGVHRETVSRYVRLNFSKPATNPPTGSEAAQSDNILPEDSSDLEWLSDLPSTSEGDSGFLFSPAETPKPATNPPTGSSGPASQCEPFRKVIEEGLAKGLSRQRIWQDLAAEHGFAGGYDSVKRFIRSLKIDHPLPFRRLECEAGQEAQVDFGTGVPVEEDGRRRRTHVFRVVLSCSRKGFSEVRFRQTTEDFIRCLEDAFWHFGGVPATLVIDNLRAAVSRADWYEPELHPKLREFCTYYGVVILPTRPYTPRHKGKIERGVGYVKNNALKGRAFGSLEEENRHLWDWERSVADTRIHGTTRRQVGQFFAEVERKALRPLPAERFPFFHEAKRSVHPDGHVEVEKAYYSVPPEYVRAEVWARWDSRVVRIFNSRLEQIAMHVRKPPGKFSTLGPHLASEKISGIERGAAYLLKKAGGIGPYTGQWAEKLLQHRGIEGMRPMLGLLSLTRRYPSREIEKACQIAVRHGVFRLRTLREILERRESPEEPVTFLEEHPIIRSLAERTKGSALENILFRIKS